MSDVTPDRLFDQLIYKAPHGIQGLYLGDIDAFTGGGTWAHNSELYRSQRIKMGQAQKAAIESIPPEPEFGELFDCTDVEAVGSPTQVVADPAKDGVSLEEASKALGLHTDTIKKRLRKGTIQGFKVAEKYGERWLVSRSALPDRTLKAVTSPAQALPDHNQEGMARPTQVVADHNHEAVPGYIPDYVADGKLVSIIENQAHQLKAAGDVIMYLRSQIEEKDTQLKLLTDSQHKRGFWTRFYGWFIGARS